MFSIFIKVLEMSLYGSIAIGIVLLARLLFRRCPKKVLIFFWIAVAIRLLCPFNFSSHLSLLNIRPQTKTETVVTDTNTEKVKKKSFSPLSKEDMLAIKELHKLSNNKMDTVPSDDSQVMITDQVDKVEQTVEVEDTEPDKTIEKTETVTETETKKTESSFSKAKLTMSYWKSVPYVWAGISLSMMLLFVIRYLRFLISMRKVRSEDGKYYIGDIDSPFVVGYIKPKICIPEYMDEGERDFILRHESMHIKNRDGLIKLLCYFTLCIHWFNPLVWIAFIMVCADIEMRVDEQTINECGLAIKKAYCKSIVVHAVEDPTGNFMQNTAFCGLGFGGMEAKIRVKNLLKKRITSTVIQITAITLTCAIAIFSSSCALTKKTAVETTGLTIGTADTTVAPDVVSDVVYDPDAWYTVKTIPSYYSLDIYAAGDYICHVNRYSEDLEIYLIDKDGTEKRATIPASALKDRWDSFYNLEVLGVVWENNGISVYLEGIRWNLEEVVRINIDPVNQTYGEMEDVLTIYNSDDLIWPVPVGSGMFLFVSDYKSDDENQVTMYGFWNGEKVIEQDVSADIPSSKYTELCLARAKTKDLIMMVFVDNDNYYSYSFVPSTKTLTFNGDASDLQYADLPLSVMDTDSNTYSRDTNGILANGNPYIYFKDTDADFDVISTGHLLNVTDDAVYMLVTDYDTNYATYDYRIAIFTKQQGASPNAGKETVNILIDWGGSIRDYSSAVERFNSQSDKYYLNIVSYNDFGGELTQEELIELISSGQYDAVLGSFDQIPYYYMDELFIDLNDEIELDPSLYYTNITDSMKIDGKLYSMPLNYMMSTIVTDKKNIKEGQTGFTFDEYAKFVKEVNNGEDLIAPSGRDFVCLVLGRDIGEWVKDGKADFDQESFYSMLDYVDNFVDFNYTNSGENRSQIVGYEDVLLQLKNTYDSPVILAQPTGDGKSFVAQIDSQIGISSSSTHKEACIEFIEILLSEDIQEGFYTIPINREAAVDQAEKYILPNDDLWDQYFNAIESIDQTNYLYIDFMDIDKEIVPYLKGEISREQLVDNLNKMVQTYIDGK